MKRVGVITAMVVWIGVAVSSASGAPLPTAWQPVVSNAGGAIGQYATISQPTNVTGVFSELPATNLPETGTGILSWSAANDRLSWRGGPAVAVNPAVTASYTLREPSSKRITPPRILVSVTAGELPAQAASDPLTVAIAPATGGFAESTRDTARGSAVFNGNLYLGVENNVTSPHTGEVWRTANGTTWVEAAPGSFGQTGGSGRAIQHVDSFIVFGGQLFAGTDSGQIWRTLDGTTWTQATPTPGYSQNITSFAIFNNLLFANQANAGSPGGVFGSSNGTTWTNVFQFGEPQEEYTHDLQVFDGSLFSEVGSYKGYLGIGGGEIASSANGTAWQPAAADGFGDAGNTDISGLAVFGTYLYAGTFNAAEGAQVWRTSDGSTWQQVAAGGFGDSHNTIVHELIVFGGNLYAGTENDIEGGEIWRTADGISWTLANVAGFGTGEQQRIRSFFKLGGYLYATGENDCEGAPPGCQEHGLEIWRLP